VIDRDGYEGVSIARTLGRLGVPMYLVGQDGISTPGWYSRYWAHKVRWDFARPEEESMAFLLDLGAKIRATHGSRSILFTQKDWIAVFLERNRELLQEEFVFPKPVRPVVRTLLNKWEMHSLAQQHRIPTPATACPTSLAEAGEFLESAGLPIVIKEADPYLGNHTPTAVIHSERELMDVLAQRQAVGGPLNLVLQEYIPGGVDSVWMCNGYFAPNPDHSVTFTGRKLRQLSPTGVASLAVCEPNQTVAAQTRRFMEATGFRGCVGIGYRYDGRDGLYKILDVNPRVSGVFRLFEGTNEMDVVRACYLDLTGQEVPVTAPQAGRKWMLEDHLWARLSGLTNERMGLAEWIRPVRAAREMHWFAADDPLPMLMWLRDALGWTVDALKRVRTNTRQASAAGDAGLRQQLDQTRQSEAELRRALDETRSALQESEASLEAIHQTRAWRLITRWWRIKRRLTRRW
jgi:predicted ATP-grasp superfamily ATP-dependent carboligase